MLSITVDKFRDYIFQTLCNLSSVIVIKQSVYILFDFFSAIIGKRQIKYLNILSKYFINPYFAKPSSVVINVNGEIIT